MTTGLLLALLLLALLVAAVYVAVGLTMRILFLDILRLVGIRPRKETP